MSTKKKNKVSYVIPHYGDTNLLLRHLHELNGQAFNDFEVLVVIDDKGYKTNIKTKAYKYPLKVIFVGQNRGPATARNLGVSQANSDIIVFVGSDCLPHKNLIAQHWWSHQVYQFGIVQGYTPWHEEAASPITNILDASGLQANWNALKRDGKWIDVGSANYCLTTNYSITRTRFNYIGKFDEEFTGAAWEDIEFGYRAGRLGLGLVINPNAINYHHHFYDLRSFYGRCAMEARHRWTLCMKHPEMAWQILNPSGLRKAIGISLPQIYTDSREIIYSNQVNFDDKVNAFMSACTLFSAASALERMGELENTLRYYLEAQNAEEALKMLAGTKSLRIGHLSFALHTAEWAIVDNDQWYNFAYAGVVHEAVGDKQMAIYMYKEAVARNPADEFIVNKVVELTK